MNYKIGEVAKILGISPDLLRYYERKGVVRPEKEQNGYRSYDAWDINFLMDCLWFKNFNFSIEEIADIVKIPSTQQLGQLLAGKENELRETILRCQRLLIRSEHHRADLRKIDTLLHRCEIGSSIPTHRFINRIGNTYIEGREASQAALEWVKIIPFNQRCFEFDLGDHDPEHTRWGYSITDEYMELLGFDTTITSRYFPARRCIHTVFKSSGGRDGFQPSLLQYAFDYAKENRLTPDGTVRGVILASVMENGTLYGFFEAWIPIL